MTCSFFARQVAVLKPTIAAMLLALVTTTFNFQAHAQTPSTVGEDAIRAGLAAQEARRHDVAVREFSRAISSGKLTRRRMTYALYRRAVSNRAQKQPAQAISDLNSALYFKGDLSPGDRTAAIEERMRAFRDAGVRPTTAAISDKSAPPASPWAASSAPIQKNRPRIVSTTPPRVVEPVQIAPPKSAAPRSTASLSPTAPLLAPARNSSSKKAPRKRTAAATSSSFRTRVAAAPPVTARPSRSYATPKVERGTGVTNKTRPIPQKTTVPASPWRQSIRSLPGAPASPPPKQPQTWSKPGVKAASLPAISTAAVKRKPRPTKTRQVQAPSLRTTIATPSPATVPRSAPITTASKPGSSVNQLLGGIFGSSLNNPQQTSSIVTGSIRRAPSATPPVLRPTQTTTAAQSVAATPPSRPASRPPTPSGYEIEVARLRNQHRAEALASQIMVQYPNTLWSRKSARVVEVPGGAEGAKYAVKYGAYKNRGDLADMCERFKSDGLDCNVIKRN